MDLGELNNDPIKEKLQKFEDSIDKIQKTLDIALNSDLYDTLSVKEKLEYDIFLAFTLNTLYWMYLRSNDEDPNNNEVKTQFDRVKDYMRKAKEANDRHTIRPRINQNVAARFVKHGINYKSSDAPPNKKIRFED